MGELIELKVFGRNHKEPK